MADESQQVERARAALEAAEQALAEALDARAARSQDVRCAQVRLARGVLRLPRDHEVIARMVERVQVFPKDSASAQ